MGRETYHPILQKHGLCKAPHDDKSGSGISPLDVLNELLKTDKLSPDQVTSACETIKVARDDSRKEKAEVESPNKKEGKVEPSVSEANVDDQSPSDQDPDRRTRHVALEFYYDGTNYSGLAQNIGQPNDKSVEIVLFEVLKRTNLILSRETSHYSRCGRTDKGVSSAGQIVAFHLKSAIPLTATKDEDGKEAIEKSDLPTNSYDSVSAWVLPRKKIKKKKGKSEPSDPTVKRQKKELREYDYAKILNNLLPPDIRVVGWCPVSDQFSARFSATTRTYRYFFVHRPATMNLEKIQQGLDLLVGKHDFRNFCKMDVEKVSNFERLIHSAKVVVLGGQGDSQNDQNVKKDIIISRDDDRVLCYIQIIGQAFLWHQIRFIVHVLFLVGRELESPSVVSEMLNIERYPGKPSYPLAPELPLVLHRCGYPNLRVGASAPNLWLVTHHLERQWEELALAAARIRNCIDGIKTDSLVLRRDLEEFAESIIERRNKKRRRHGDYDEGNKRGLNTAAMQIDESKSETDNVAGAPIISWGDAMSWLQQRYTLIPDGDEGAYINKHIPLLQRSMGTTYEEKVAALLQQKESSRRRRKYEENRSLKESSASTDDDFFTRMTKQGGSGFE